MSLRCLVPVLGLAIAIASVSTPVRAGDGPSPAYVADVRVRCTTGGKTSELCVEYFVDVVAGANKNGVDRSVDDDIRGCFRDAKQHELTGPSSSSGFYAEKLLRAGEGGDARAKNKFVDECVRVTALQLGEEWRTSAMMGAFRDRVGRALRDDVEKTCGAGARAAVYKKADVLTVVAYAKSANKTVVFQGTDPEGSAISVLCNGYVVGKTKDGKPINRAPLMADDLRSAETKACVNSCRSSASNAACVEGYRRGKTTPYCDSVCKERCR